MINKLGNFFQWMNEVFNSGKEEAEETHLDAFEDEYYDDDGYEYEESEEVAATPDMSGTYFRKIEELGIFSPYGPVIDAPLPYIKQTGLLMMPFLQNMFDHESTEFVEGYLAGLFYGGKVSEMSARMAVAGGALPQESAEEIRVVQIDTVLTTIATYLESKRKSN